MNKYKDIERWINDSKHLPEFMRDFHDQKDLFKAIHKHYDSEINDSVSWKDAHIYTIDLFLFFMANHGYTLQKNRSSFDFKSVQETLDESRKSREGIANFLIQQAKDSRL